MSSSASFCFTQSQMEAIANALGDTSTGLTGSEIGHLLEVCKISDEYPTATKRHRLLNAFALHQNKHGNRTSILAFIRKTMKPERFLNCHDRFEPMRENLNRALVFCSLSVDETGALIEVEQAKTLSEAKRRAQNLRADLTSRGVHPDVLVFCREELLVDDYFHAVMEAVKSVLDKIRKKTGLSADGNTLVDKALAGDIPMLAINSLRSENDKSEQKGFTNLVRGAVSMYRNPTAHAARIHWPITKEDAEDILSLVSLVHRRLDSAVIKI